MKQMNFGDALEALKAGGRVTRDGWNDTGRYLTRVHDWNGNFSTNHAPTWSALPFIAMGTADNEMTPWQASQGDALAEDWQLAGDQSLPTAEAS